MNRKKISLTIVAILMIVATGCSSLNINGNNNGSLTASGTISANQIDKRIGRFTGRGLEAGGWGKAPCATCQPTHRFSGGPKTKRNRNEHRGNKLVTLMR